MTSVFESATMQNLENQNDIFVSRCDDATLRNLERHLFSKMRRYKTWKIRMIYCFEDATMHNLNLYDRSVAVYGRSVAVSNN